MTVHRKSRWLLHTWVRDIVGGWQNAFRHETTRATIIFVAVFVITYVVVGVLTG
jgi:hypothetical protein